MDSDAHRSPYGPLSLFWHTLTIETFPLPNRRWFFPRAFVFRNEAGEQIGYASSLWALLNIVDRRMSKPDPALPFMPDNSDLTPPQAMPGVVAELPVTPDTAAVTPLYTDLDMNQHVNNTRYLDWCCNAFGVDVLKEYVLSSFALNYHQEVRPGETLRTELRRDGDAFSFSGFSGEARRFDVGGTLTRL